MSRPIPRNSSRPSNGGVQDLVAVGVESVDAAVHGEDLAVAVGVGDLLSSADTIVDGDGNS